ncbi:ABC transporter permease [Gemmatimonas sp.]|jgi:ABC-2 type transport system permease protein|uniref:ABC transporter permease n=1 Tax=Gemmatimonas sp. TaxID=1962908 RepID=UPI0037BE3B91
MIVRIARKEMTEMFRDGRFRWAAAILLGLLSLATVTGVTNARVIAQEHRAAQEEMRGFWTNQGAKNPHSAAHYGLWVFKPKMPLAFVDQGVDQYTGVTTLLEAHKQNEFTRRPAMDNAAVARFGEWSAAAVLQLLVPLLIIMLAFPAVAGERESGTLRQVAALGVSARSLLLGKALGTAGALAVVLVPATILGVTTLAIGAGFGTRGDDLLRFAAMVAVYLTYFAVILAVSLAVSARVPSLRAALLVLLAFWTANSLIAPRAVTDAARRIYPTPSSFQFAANVAADASKGLDGHNPEDIRRKAVEAKALAEYRAISLDALPVNFDAIAMQASEEYGNQVYDKHFGALYDTYRSQNAMAQLGGLAAPLLAVRSLSMGLAGTDIEQHRDFAVKAEAYRRGLVKWSNDYFRDNTRTGEWDWKAPPELWAKYPPFHYEAPSLRAMIAPQLKAIVALGAWLVLAMVALLWAPNLRVL